MIKSIPKEAKDILEKIKGLKPDGNIYLVGGYLRDLLLSRKSADFDFCLEGDVEKFSEKVSSFFKGHCFVLDKEFQTYRVLIRVEGRKINLDFSPVKDGDISRDLRRRDYTVNALAVPLDGRYSLIDANDSLNDLKERKIRMVSEQNLIDDPLRLLRAFRISAETGLAIEKKTFKFIKSSANLIKDAASERIREELYKILAADNSVSVFKQLDRAGLLEILLPEVTSCRNLAKVYYTQEGVLTHLYKSMERVEYIVKNADLLFDRLASYIKNYLQEEIPGGYPRWITLKLAGLLHDVGKAPTAKVRSKRLRFFYHEEEGEKMVKEISKRLRLSSGERDLIAVTALGHMRPGNLAYQQTITDRAKYRFFRDYGDNAVSLLLLSLADRFTYLSNRQIAKGRDRHHSAVMDMLRHYYLHREKVKPDRIINGSQIMNELGLSQGPLIGKILDSIKEAQALGKIKDYGQAVAHAKKIVEKTG